MQIGRGHLLHHLAARRHFGEVGRALGRARRLPSGDHRAGEERLAEVNLPSVRSSLVMSESPAGMCPPGKSRRIS